MATVRKKVVQYLQDARAAEYALTTLLAANIAVTPEGDYRQQLESQRERSREREHRLSERLGDLGAQRIWYVGFDAARVVGGQGVALATMPLQLLRGPGGAERLLKNARDLCAAAAVLVADYRAVERVARAVDDEVTATLASELCAEADQAMSEHFEALDRLADAVVSAEIKGEPVYRLRRIGAVQMLRIPQLRESMYRLREQTADVLHQARREATRLEEELRTEPEGPVVQATLPIPDYDNLTVEEIGERLSPLSQAELATIEAYERRNRNRAEILEAINDLRGEEPWPGYDELKVTDIRARLRDAETDQIRNVLDYERAHKNRSSIVNAPEAQGKVSPGT